MSGAVKCREAECWVGVGGGEVEGGGGEEG